MPFLFGEEEAIPPMLMRRRELIRTRGERQPSFHSPLVHFLIISKPLLTFVVILFPNRENCIPFMKMKSIAKRLWKSMGAYELLKMKDEEKTMPRMEQGQGQGQGQGHGPMDMEMAKIHNKDNSSSSNNGKGNKRLASLDVFRGLTVAIMIFVDDAGGIIPAINHSPWNGVTLADFVMPFFLFIVGVSLGLVYKNVSNKISATRKTILRALKLLIVGIVLQGGYFHGLNDLTYGVDIEQIRWLGILQRIACGYLFAALSEIWLRSNCERNSFLGLMKTYCMQWLFAFILIVIYMGLLYGLYVPDWQYEVSVTKLPNSPLNLGYKTYSVKCGVRGDVGPACNAVGMIDRYVLGIGHLYQRPVYARTEECSVNSPDYGSLPPTAPSWCQAPFDPEGILSTVMAVVTCFVGLHFGHVLVHFKGHKERMMQCIVPSLGLIIFGCLLDSFGMHLNKALYTFSYMCVTSGTAGLLLAGTYLLVDVYGYRRLTVLLEWIGMNALVIYVFAACNLFAAALQGFYWRYPENNIINFIGIKR